MLNTSVTRDCSLQPRKSDNTWFIIFSVFKNKYTVKYWGGGLKSIKYRNGRQPMFIFSKQFSSFNFSGGRMRREEKSGYLKVGSSYFHKYTG